MSGESSERSGGVGFFGLLAIVFIVLKLTAVIDWPWWVVLMPLYGPLAAILSLLVGLVLLVWFCTMIERRRFRGTFSEAIAFLARVK